MTTSVDRALLLAEWGSQEICVVCVSPRPGSQFEPPHGHQHHCAMDLALSERGFFTQDDRERARARLRERAP